MVNLTKLRFLYSDLTRWKIKPLAVLLVKLTGVGSRQVGRVRAIGDEFFIKNVEWALDFLNQMDSEKYNSIMEAKPSYWFISYPGLRLRDYMNCFFSFDSAIVSSGKTEILCAILLFYFIASRVDGNIKNIRNEEIFGEIISQSELRTELWMKSHGLFCDFARVFDVATG